jgi:thiamine-phosphate pyrophosphorylase
MIGIFSKVIFPQSSWSDTIRRLNKLSGLFLIIDQDLLRVKPELAMAQALSAGVKCFQYRNKHDSRKKIYDISAQLARTARRAGALFIVNDHADIAVAVDADGVHLGQDDLPIACAQKFLPKGKVIGISTHSIVQARSAEAAGADYIGFGPLFETATKDAGTVQGIERLLAIRKAISIPVIAIGGINHRNVSGVMQTGADGVAVISAVMSAPDIKQAAQDMLRIIQESVAQSRK